MADPLEDVTPPHLLSGLQSQLRQDCTVLRLHVGFRSLAIELTPSHCLMGAGAAHSVGLLDDFDQPIRMLQQLAVDGAEILHEPPAVPLTAKSL
jgi:hypothetical protein